MKIEKKNHKKKNGENRLTSRMISASGENNLGNNQGTNVPTAPNINPVIVPIVTSDFNSIRACRYLKSFRILSKRNPEEQMLKLGKHTQKGT